MAKCAVIFEFLDGKAGAAILAASAVVSAWFAAYGGFVFFGDSPMFFVYANQLFHYLHPGNNWYTIGYPLLILLTGFPVTGSLVPLLVVQAIFAALTPWLAFKTFAMFDRKAGIIAGIVCLASLTPFFFQNTFFHDGACLFFGFLSIAFASAFFAVSRPAVPVPVARRRRLCLFHSAGSRWVPYRLRRRIRRFRSIRSAPV